MGIQTLKDTFREIVKRYDAIKVVEVVSVAFPYFVAETAEGTTLNNLMLVTEESDNGIYCIPKVGSSVMVAMLDDTTGFIVGYGELEEVYLRGDQHGGLVKVSELTTKLNNLENKLNTFMTTFTAHVHPFVNAFGIPSSTTPSPTPAPSALVPTIISDIENNKVKHG